jgi:hypothetical protein
MLEISADLVDKQTLSEELRRRGLLAHFRSMSGNSDFV